MKKELVTHDDFSRVDIRVGEIKSADIIEKSAKLLKLIVDLGEDYGIVQILSGIAKYFSPQDLVGMKLMFVANLAPRSMMGLESQGMLFTTDVGDKPVLIEVPFEVPNGTALI